MADEAVVIPDAPASVVYRFTAFFFLFGCLGGIVTVYLPPYIKSLGFTSGELGTLLAIPPLLTVIVPLVWAQLGDRFGIRLILLRVMLFGLVAVFSAFHFVTTGIAVGAALIGLAVFRSGVVPMADALALSNLSSKQYVRIIVANSLSWITSTLVFAYVFSELPAADHWAVKITHVMMAITAVYSLFLTANLQPKTERPSLRQSLSLLKDRRILRFLILLMIYWASMGPFDTLLAIGTNEVGYGASAGGYAFAIAIGAEVLVMTFGKRFGFDFFNMPSNEPKRARKLMFIVMAATSVRWLLSSIAPNLGVFLALQTIHGLSFGAFILLAVGEMRVLVPEGLRATGQALMMSSMGGVGGMIGALIAGNMHGIGGSPLAFQVAGGIAALALLFDIATSRKRE
jgi:MFS family permease